MDEQSLSKKQRRELRRQEKIERRTASQRSHRAKQLVGWLAGIAVIVAIFGGLVYLANQSPSGVGPKEVTADDHVKGPPNSGVLLVEYSDFQCPACAQYYPIIQQVVEQYSDQLTFVYRHFPLRTIHKNSQLAAQAAEAAGLQDKFWEMHDQLFEHQTEWANLPDPTDTFIGYAQAIGMNTEQFAEELTSDFVEQQVNADYASGNGAGVDSTPTFYINGTKMKAPSTLGAFQQMIDLELSIATPTN